MTPGPSYRAPIQPDAVPELAEILARASVVSLPMRVRFRGLEQREALLIEGPAGWGEFSAFPEYGDAEAAVWLASALEMAWLGPPEPQRLRVPVNATIPDVVSGRVPEILAGFSGCTTVKIKVGSAGKSLETTLCDDEARIEAVLAEIPQARIRVDANGAWTVPEAYRAACQFSRIISMAGGFFDYLEQPCSTIPELVKLRELLARAAEAGELPQIKVAADESIRRAADPFRVARERAADQAVVKVAPLGGPRALLRVARSLHEHGLGLTVSSALDTAVGMSAGLAAAAALPGTDIPACGLGTGTFFYEDVAAPIHIIGGTLPNKFPDPEPDRLSALAAAATRKQWWFARLQRCYAMFVDSANG